MATVYDPDLDPMAMSDDLVGIDGPQSMPTKVTGMRARPTGIEALGVMRTSGGTIGFSAEEQRMESDLRARLNELLVLTKEGTVDAVAGLGGMLTRDSDGFEGAAPAGGMQAGEQRVRAHRQSVYGLTREPPPWSVKPGAPTTSAKVPPASTSRSPVPGPAPCSVSSLGARTDLKLHVEDARLWQRQQPDGRGRGRRPPAPLQGCHQAIPTTARFPGTP